MAATTAMTSTDPQRDTVPFGAAILLPTHWSVVLAAAGSNDSTHARDALESSAAITGCPFMYSSAGKATTRRMPRI